MSLDATAGGAAADSYCTLSEANSYHDSRSFNDEWGASSDAAKEKALKWAARQLDVSFDWRGRKTYRDQARAWPRAGAMDDDGFYWDSTGAAGVPLLLKQAQAEFAFQLLKEDWTQGLGSVTDDGTTLGPLKTTKEEHNSLPASVKKLVGPLTNGGTGSVRSLEVELG